MKLRYPMIFLLSFTALGCYYDNEEVLYNCSVDVASVKYTTTISPILNGYGCLACHKGVVPSGGIDLSTYTNLITQVNNGKFWGSVNHLSGYKPMPQGGSKISSCDLKKIKAWIDTGAPNN